MAFKPKAGASSLDEKPPKAAKAKAAKAERPARVTGADGTGPLCLCGCGEHTKGGRFRPGHDARYHAAQKKAAAAQ